MVKSLRHKATRSVVNMFKELMVDMDWVARHEFWNSLVRNRRTFNIRLAIMLRLGPDQLIDGANVGRPVRRRRRVIVVQDRAP